MPIVSILLPTYKNASRLTLAIESVISQTYQDWELIIIDDGLTQGIKEQLKDYSIRDTRIIVLVNDQNVGIQKSLNRGLRQARGKYIARIDDDDIWIDTTKIAQQVEFFEHHSEYVLVGTHATICDENGILLGQYTMPQDDASIRRRMLIKNCFLHPTIMAKKIAIDQVGGYDERVESKHIEDYALWLQLGQIGKFANLPLFAVQLTIHADSLTFKNRFVQAKRMLQLIPRYQSLYPNFYPGYLILIIRGIGFGFLKIFPIPKRVLYFIQKIYKQF